jgi:dihydropteroate synthase
LGNLGTLGSLAVPIVVGLSRKKTLGHVTGKDADARTAAGIAAAVLAVSNGANIVRTHDVGVTVDAMKMVEAVRQAK